MQGPQTLHLPSLSPPLMTADLKWVDSYFQGLSEGSKVSWDESGPAEGSSVTTGCEASPAEAERLC